MQAWWDKENYLKNIKNHTLQKLLTGSVYLVTRVIIKLSIPVLYSVLWRKKS